MSKSVVANTGTSSTEDFAALVTQLADADATTTTPDAARLRATTSVQALNTERPAGDNPGDGAREHTETALRPVTVNLNGGELEDDGSQLVLWSYLKGGLYDIEAAHDNRVISRADAEERLRVSLADHGMQVTRFLTMANVLIGPGTSSHMPFEVWPSDGAPDFTYEAY